MATPTSPSAPAATPAVPPASPKPSAKDNLSLKVVRLSKPMFNIKPPLLSEPTDLTAQILGAEDPLGISSMLTLPSTFGKLFIGEVFSSYISIHNGSSTNVTSVAIKVALQTPSSDRIVLLEVPGTAIPVFSPGDSQDFVISQQIVEEGTYILVCSTGYIRSDGEKKHFRKFFQFEVEQPLQITNKTQIIDVESLNSASDTRLNNYLKPAQIQQFLYKLSETNLNENQNKQLQQAIGHLEIEWKSSTSGMGKMTTPPIKRVLSRPQEFRLEITDLPKEIHLEVPFQAKCTITNCSVQKLAPKLCALAEKQIGIAVNGVSGYSLPALAPGESISVHLSFFPLLPGIQSISGLRIVEQQFDKKFDFDKLVDVFVLSPSFTQ